MKILSLPILILASVLLSACLSDSGSSRSGNTVTPQIVNTPAPVIVQQPVTNPPATANPPASNSNLLRLSMHYSLLLGQPHLWTETGGVTWYKLDQYASAGSSSIKLDSTSGLVQQQLITYKGRNNQYYTAQIQSIQNNNVRLTTPLQQDVYAGSNAWNFYDNGAHPNWAGYSAIADFSVRKLGWNRLNQGKHVLLGDSWFGENSIFSRLKSRLPGASISNKGLGGNNAGDLLARFDADVRWQNPNYVWIMTGTNDYWQDISASTYKSNMRQLINKVKSIGAVPIVFDSSVAPMNYGSDHTTRLSRSYVTAVDQLASEN